MRIEANIAPVAALFAEPSRAAILSVLLDGRALPAGELANLAGVSPTAASAHLTKLIDGGLLAVEAEGRHRYYRLASAGVAQVLEELALLTKNRRFSARRRSHLPRERCVRLAAVMIIWLENLRSPSQLLWKVGAGSCAEKVNVTRSRMRKGDSGLPEMESIFKRSSRVGTDLPDNVSIGRSVARTWLDLSARDCSRIGVGPDGLSATIVTPG
jgi:DNA-binding transcriptional ArsR family regulator